MPCGPVATVEPDPIEVGVLEVFPNPSTGEVSIRWPTDVGNGLLQVFNTNGVSMLQEKITLSNGLRLLSLENYPPGIYFVHLRAASGSLVRKLVIQ